MPNPNQMYLVMKDGVEELVDFTEIFEKLGVESCIRIVNSEYQNINPSDQYFTHFNMEKGLHIPGKVYLLPRILRSGRIESDKVIPPLLSFEKVYMMECIDAEDFVKYEELKHNVFEHSMINIKDIASLQDVILARYSQSRPLLTREDIISKGVGVTYLKVVKWIENVPF